MSGKIGLFIHQKKEGDQKKKKQLSADNGKGEIKCRHAGLSLFLVARQPPLTAKSENDIGLLQDLIEINPLDIDLQVVVRVT